MCGGSDWYTTSEVTIRMWKTKSERDRVEERKHIFLLFNCKEEETKTRNKYLCCVVQFMREKSKTLKSNYHDDWQRQFNDFCYSSWIIVARLPDSDFLLTDEVKWINCRETKRKPNENVVFHEIFQDSSIFRFARCQFRNGRCEKSNYCQPHINSIIFFRFSILSFSSFYTSGSGFSICGSGCVWTIEKKENAIHLDYKYCGTRTHTQAQPLSYCMSSETIEKRVIFIVGVDDNNAFRNLTETERKR